jgi:hypothetical protein
MPSHATLLRRTGVHGMFFLCSRQEGANARSELGH